MSQSKLIYLGKAKYIEVLLYPYKKPVKVSRDHPYIFKNTDVLDDKAIKYYRQYIASGVRLQLAISTNKSAESTEIHQNSTHVEVTSEDIHTDSNEGTTELESITNENNESDDTVESDQSTGTDDFSSDKSDEVTHEDNQSTDEATNGELVEFLDMNYDDDSIRALAKDAGVGRIYSSWDKATIIEKILSTNSEYVVKLIRNS